MPWGRRIHRDNKRIHVGDQVQVIAGAHRGESGKVLRIFADTDRLLVEGVNIVKRHQKGQERGRGEIIEREGSIHLSNVALLDADGNIVRTGSKVNDAGKKTRVNRKTGKPV